MSVSIDSRRLVFPGASANLSTLVSRHGWRRVALFRGVQAFDACAAAARLRLDQIACDFDYYVVPNALPTDLSIRRAAEHLSEKHFDAILAVGGGTVIDSAKGALWHTLQTGKTTRPVFVAVPTTAGTGSEVTPFATYFRDRIKHSYDDPRLLPDVAIVDAELTYSLPAYQTACTGADTVCQAIESLWSKRANAESRKLALRALRLAGQHLERSVHKPNAAARAGMVEAAHLSGLAIALTRTTAAHAFSYALTAHYGVPHGHAVALFMAPILDHHASCSSAVTSGLLELQTRALSLLSAPEAGSHGSRWDALMSSWGMCSSLAARGVRSAEYGDLLAAANVERLSNHPIPLDFQRMADAMRASDDLRATPDPLPNGVTLS